MINVQEINLETEANEQPSDNLVSQVTADRKTSMVNKVKEVLLSGARQVSHTPSRS